MGQYIKGEKIGTCENMYYLTLEEAKILALQGVKDDDGISISEYLTDNQTRFRFPWPEEQETGAIREAFKTFNIPVPEGMEVNHTEKVIHMALPTGGYGFNVFLPCPYSPDFKFKTSTGGVGKKFLNIEFQAIRNGEEKTIFKCPHCGQSQRFSSDDVLRIKESAREYYKVYDGRGRSLGSGNQSLFEYANKVIDLIK